MLPCSKERVKKEKCTESFFCCAEAKESKDSNHLPKSYFLERAAQLPDTGTSETESAEKAEGALPASDLKILQELLKVMKEIEATAVDAPAPIHLELAIEKSYGPE